MKRFLIPLLLSFSFTVFAQPRIDIGLTVGGIVPTSLTAIDANPYAYASFYGNTQKVPVNFSKAFGLNGTVKGLIDFRNLQLGIGLEGGSIKSTVGRQVGLKVDIEENFMFSMYVIPGVVVEKQNIAAPYLTPHLMLHVKFNFSDHVYLYTGPIGGRMFSKNDLSWNGKSSGWVAGGNLGLVIRLSDRISLDIAEGWRMAWVRGDEITFDNRRQWYNPEILGPKTHTTQDNTHVAYAINSYNLSYANSSIGIRLTL